ncbi:hypothetical protein H5410_028198 [Solanum commersonii]|uniref:Uncharacterized protein n=1 Tax=Solanum commersonii TaxID=4109 RepID=A0A9J5Z202_SOLCO|nr:hypothetical protein H5410_028198 [Solanum commersonii]
MIKISTGYKKLNFELSYGRRIKKTHFQLGEYELLSSIFTDCAAENRSATLVEIADELGDPPFNQFIAFSVLPSASSYFGSLGGTVLLHETNRRHADCSFPRLLIHFLQDFAHKNKGRCMSIRRLAKLDSAIHRLSFLVLFSPFCSVLRLSVYASSRTSNS